MTAMLAVLYVWAIILVAALLFAAAIPLKSGGSSVGDVVNLQQPEKKLDPRCAAEMLMANALYEMGKLGFNKMAVLRIVSGFVDMVLIDDLKWRECAEDLWNCRHLLSAKEIDFIQQLRYYRHIPSARQLMWLDDIIRSLKEREELLANPPKPRRKPKVTG